MSLWGTARPAGVPGDGSRGSASISGFAVSSSVALGATFWNGLVIAALVSATYGGGSFHGGPPGAPGDASALLPQLGVLVDWYPAPERGLHVGGTFGLGGFLVEDSSNRNYRGFAPAGSLRAGAAGWLGPEASVDIAAVFSLAASASSHDQYRQNTGYDLMSASGGFEWSIVFN
jgi:hypothetical protein